MSDKLLPCPFCGSRCVNDTTEPEDEDCWVCPDCVCTGPCGQTPEEATALWNNRSRKIDIRNIKYKIGRRLTSRAYE